MKSSSHPRSHFLYWALALCSLAPLKSFAQSKSVQGIVLDKEKRPVPYANIKIISTNSELRTDKDGRFTINFEGKSPERVPLRITFIGKKTVEGEFILSGGDQLAPIYMEDLSLALDEISVQAKQTEARSNSSYIIDRDLIERYPSLSLNDLLNLLPNRRMAAPSLQELQNVTLRGAFEKTRGSSRNVNELSNSFGVAIIVDDIAMSNDGNMQSQNPAWNGLARANVSLAESKYNLPGNKAASDYAYSGESNFGGIDLRQIPTANIERIEVISGVAPVRYGEQSHGAIIVERQAGKSPAYLSVQSRNNATNYSFSKGFILSPKLGAINTDVSFTNSYADNRDKLKQYQRINGSLIWTTLFGEEDRWKHTLSTTYNKTLDRVNRDPDDPLDAAINFGSWNFNASSRLSYKPKSNFFENVGLNMAVSTAHQVTYRENYYNDAFVLYTDTMGTGIVEGIYEKGQYTAVEHIDGRPLNLSGRLETNARWNIGGITHYFNIGSTVNYSINNGKGRLADPSRPNKGIGTFGERYYDFSLLHSIYNIGVYAEDRFSIDLFGRPLNIAAGVRWDTQNTYNSFSPRTNISYRISKNAGIGIAYGLAFKAPGMSHRYPGPSFRDFVLLNAYNGFAAQSTSRIYTLRHDPDNSNLKSQQTQTVELSGYWRKGGHSLAMNVFHKISNNGISNLTRYLVLDLPEYTATPVPGQKPIVEQTGYRKYMTTVSDLSNVLHSQNSGLELMYRLPKIAAIYTSFYVSGGITRSEARSSAYTFVSYGSERTNPDDVYIAVFPNEKSISYLSNGRVGTATHIPKLKFVVELTAGFQFMNYSKRIKDQLIPVGYYSVDYNYHLINPFDPNNPKHAEIYEQRVLDAAKQNSLQNRFIADYSLSLAKELNKQLRISLNVFNFIDYQPRIYDAKNSQVFVPNGSPSYGAQINYKF